MINPACDGGSVEPSPAGPGFVVVCACGNVTPAEPSKTKAKAAQRTHRFPPIPEDTP